ncbi:MAG: hypothetical protein AAB392_02070 [Patescibacteria group bacterium]
MLSISQFFEKFKKLQKNDKLLKQTLILTIKEISGAIIKEENLDIKEEKVYLKTSPIVRNQIFMYKEKIENSLKDQKVFFKLI